MRKIVLLALVCVLTVASAVAQQGVVQTTACTLGVANIKTLQFTGSGQNFSVGQNYTASDPWRALDVQVIAPFHSNRKTDVAEVGRLAGINATN